MSLSPYTSTLATGARADSATETYDVETRGRKGLVLVTDVTAIGNGHSFVQGADVTVPKVITLNTNDQFSFNSNVYTIAPGTYATLALLVAAIAAATKSGGARFDVVVTPSVSGAGILFTNVASGVHAEAFAVGTHDALVSVLGLTDAWTIAHTEAAGGDGTYSQTTSILGVDPASGKTWVILTAAALATVTTQVLQVHPQMTAVTNLVANSQLPATIRVSTTHTNDDAVTRTVAVQLVS